MEIPTIQQYQVDYKNTWVILGKQNVGLQK